MNKTSYNPKAMVWTPVLFCALLSVTTMIFPGGGNSTFYCFLPMCFLYVGYGQLALHNRIEELESKLQEWQNPELDSAADLRTD